MNNTRKFYWNEETLQYFYNNKHILKHNSIEEFVKNDCDLEEGETVEMLVNDIKKQLKEI